MDIIKILQEELGIRRGQVETTIKLIDEGNTIPFIARYRKEMTGSLDDETLRNFHERLLYLRNLEERKEAIKKNIEEQGKLTKELAKQIEEAKTLVAVEDLYRPYKQKKRTRAMIAKEKGLEPLANLILLQMTKETLEKEAEAFINEEKDVKTVEDALKVQMILSQSTLQMMQNTVHGSVRQHGITEKSHPQRRNQKNLLYLRCIMILKNRLKRLQDTVFLRSIAEKKREFFR